MKESASEKELAHQETIDELTELQETKDSMDIEMGELRETIANFDMA